MSICALSAPYPGAKRPLEEGAKLGLWDFVLLKGGTVSIPSADTFILGAWTPQYAQLLGTRKTVVLWTSSVGETDFEPQESAWLGEILNDPRIDMIWFGSQDFGVAFPEKSFFAPYPLYTEVNPPKVEKQDIVTLFCPAGPKKNCANQIIAVGLAQRESNLVLHTNIQGYDNLLSLVDHVKHPWLSEEEYHRLLASAKVNLGVSWAETFNYNCAESSLMGTASVVSPTVPIPGIVVENPNSPIDIAKGILQVANDPVNMGQQSRESLVKISKQRNEELVRVLSEKNLR